MKKRTKFLIIAMVAILLALAVGMTTTVLAQGDSEEQSSADQTPMQTFTSKVASILGLPEEQVADAFKQACQEMWDEALQQRLQEVVEDGRLTQEQADQIMEWWQNRPDALENCALPGFGRFCGGRHCMGGLGFKALP